MWSSMWSLLLLATIVVVVNVDAGKARGATKSLQGANQCSLFHGGCKYQLVLTGSSCYMANDDPNVTSNDIIVNPEATLVDSVKQTEDQIEKLGALENRLIKMMEGLSVRSLRHIRQIKSDLREMTASMNLIKMKSRGGKKGGSLECPPEFVGVGTWSSCYRFSTFNASWHQAREYCSAFGANLVALETMKEAYILDYLIKSNQEYQTPKGWWTSGNYIVRNRRWMWTSKHHLMPMQYSRWAPGEPDARSTMHCMLMYKAANYEWHDAMCSDIHNFICEIELL